VVRRTVRGPDGSQWDVKISKFRPPSWRVPDFFQDEKSTMSGQNPLLTILFWLVLAVLVFPIIGLVFELPYRLIQALFSPGYSIRARSAEPAEEELEWRSSATDDDSIRHEIATRAKPTASQA
jgi:hypothetical protein